MVSPFAKSIIHMAHLGEEEAPGIRYKMVGTGDHVYVGIRYKVCIRQQVQVRGTRYYTPGITNRYHVQGSRLRASRTLGKCIRRR